MINFFRTILYIPLYNLFVFLVALMPSHNVALAIIALTVLVRLILTPLKYKSIESQAKQKSLQADLKEIQAKHKGDRQAQSQATMQLYKDKGINPASGCLPQLIQFPILIVLYYVFRTTIGPENANLLYSFVQMPESVSVAFLWVKDVTQADTTMIFPILAGIVQFFYSRMLMPSMSMGDGDAMSSIMSKQMIYFLPVMTALIGRSLPAALSIYWVIATLVDWYQQAQGMKRLGKKLENTKVTVSVRSKKKETS